MSNNSESIERVRRAIADEGPYPPEHRRQLGLLRRNWPTLYYAIMDLISERKT